MRLSIDMGGTFTDLVLEDQTGAAMLHKTLTTLDHPASGMLAGIEGLADRRGVTRDALLAEIETIVHGTTRATNAILTGTTARTAFVTTLGHPDILVFRMGGREDPFRQDRESPPTVRPPRADVRARRADGLPRRGRPPARHRGARARSSNGWSSSSVEAVGVCLLWSVANGAHELAVGDAIRAGAPDILSRSHTSSTRSSGSTTGRRRPCIDASLKPRHVRLPRRPRPRPQAAGFDGKLLVASVSGGLLEPERLAAAPIHSINSGPALAPVAGRHYAARRRGSDDRDRHRRRRHELRRERRSHGRIPRTRETWLGEQFVGHMTGFPSVDVRTTGSGGGSIACVDAGGLLTWPAQRRARCPGQPATAEAARRPQSPTRRSMLGLPGRRPPSGARHRVDVEPAHARSNATSARRSASIATRPPRRSSGS